VLTEPASGAALIDRIGPAIVLGRSQSGIYPFHYADVRPLAEPDPRAVQLRGPLQIC
jgi:hypothetical protein